MPRAVTVGCSMKRLNRDYPPWSGHPSVQPPSSSTPAPCEPSEPSESRVAGIPRQVMLQDDMASRLAAARPVTWRGKGDLLQLPWAVPPKGCFLPVELWSGVSGLAIAMLAVGMHFYGAAAECDPVARRRAQAVMPHLVHYEKVEAVRASDFVPLLRRRRLRAILIGGGSPCQGNSLLNLNRLGLGDARSCQPQELVRLRDEFESLPEAHGIPVLSLLENVGSMPDDRKAYTEWLRSEPAMIEAGTMGWVHRRRLYWVSGLGGLNPLLTLPADWSWGSSSKSDVPAIQFQGSKPIPPRVVWESGFQPLINPKEVMAQKGQGAIHTFTREFRHPTDRVGSVFRGLLRRFEQDQLRFPPGSYEEGSLVWRDEHWRQPSVLERCQLMGIPPSVLDSVSGPPERRRQVQNSLIGNGFHLPSIMLLLCLLPQLLEGKIPTPVLDYEEQALVARLDNTVWAPGRLRTFPGLLTARDVCDSLPVCFPSIQIPLDILHLVQARLNVCELHELQGLRQLSWDQLGPVHVQGKLKSALYAGLGTQRFSGNSSRGLDHLLPPGLGKEDHILQSAGLPSPFRPIPWPDLDVQYVIRNFDMFWIPWLALSALWKNFLMVCAAPVLREWPRRNAPVSWRL